MVEYPRAAGLYSAGIGGDLESARAKPFLSGFTLPFDPLRVDARDVRVWALAGEPHAVIALQRQTHSGRWRTLAVEHAGQDGVLNALLALRGPARLRLLDGALLSAVAAVGSRPSRLSI